MLYKSAAFRARERERERGRERGRERERERERGRERGRERERVSARARERERGRDLFTWKGMSGHSSRSFSRRDHGDSWRKRMATSKVAPPLRYYTKEY